MALSTRGRGAHVAPSGVTTSLRPPRFLNVSGMWSIVFPVGRDRRSRHAAALLLPATSRTSPDSPLPRNRMPTPSMRSRRGRSGCRRSIAWRRGRAARRRAIPRAWPRAPSCCGAGSARRRPRRRPAPRGRSRWRVAARGVEFGEGVAVALRPRHHGLAAFPEKTSSSASSPPSSSRSTKHGPPTPRPTSSGNARMRDHAPRKVQTTGCSIKSSEEMAKMNTETRHRHPCSQLSGNCEREGSTPIGHQMPSRSTPERTKSATSFHTRSA